METADTGLPIHQTKKRADPARLTQFRIFSPKYVSR